MAGTYGTSDSDQPVGFCLGFEQNEPTGLWKHVPLAPCQHKWTPV